MQGTHRSAPVRFWRSVELFSPQNIPPVRRDNDVITVTHGGGEPLPWEDGARLRPPPPRARWRHTVFLGVHSLKRVRDVVEEHLGRDPDDYDERPRGESAIAALMVTDRGVLIDDSPLLSSCAWATGQLAAGDDLGDLDGFGSDTSEFRALVHAHVGDAPLTRDDLAALVSVAAAATGTGGGLLATGQEIRIQSLWVAERNAAKTDGSDFLNSFHADDLARVTAALDAADAGPALHAYLTDAATAASAPRVDVRHRLDDVKAATAPGRVPAGRWLADPEHVPALGQQLAVTLALELDRGLLGVNGPPGTGKTTMLRDVVAGVLVDRARALAALQRPAAAFAGDERWSTENMNHSAPRWIDALCGFEMVVASSNNGAIENVTRDIPGRSAIGAGWHGAVAGLDWFAGPAGRIEGVHDAWGLIAAPLGRKERRAAFVERVLWGAKDTNLGEPGVIRVLRAWQDEPAPAPDAWADAVAAFRTAEERVEVLRAERSRVYEDQQRVVALEAERAPAAAALTAADAEAERTRARAAQAAERRADAEEDHALLEGDHERHAELRPGWLARLWPFGTRVRAWNAKRAEIADALGAAAHDLRDARRAARDADQAADAAGAAVATGRAAAARIEAELAQLSAALDDDQRRLGAHFPDPAWEHDRDRRETVALWTDPEWNEARSALLVAALALHQAFLRHEARRMSRALMAAANLLKGDAPADLSRDAALAAWRALFFVAPVVSTTFASVPRMFSHLGREDLGWLLIDEAGQAAPQHAVGALWRSRRAVVVGDPLQLEPITTLSHRVQRALAREHGVDDEWLLRGLSAQALADRVSDHGTTLEGRGPDGADLWVGTPLTVHRRCDRPMFDAVNAIAYDDLMIFATPPRPGAMFRAEHPAVPEAQWLHVADDSRAQGHWIPAEGESLHALLRTLLSDGVPGRDILAVSPFRDVARRLSDLKRRAELSDMTAGTVHTAQGKEADVVILVLGGDPAKRGAKAWAARRPNLVNVAVSRARRRLFVIGDREAWSQRPYFDALADRLDRG
ncbi:DEAD/DEAH box helicase [Conexibacter woesei]|uniref:DEAD/DEAH box helicase n=1 Tax=Conexibacter woesei TaxID=191495 RepID=UPI00047D9635|nr:ATP-binding protein [Conexibacter woesei]